MSFYPESSIQNRIYAPYYFKPVFQENISLKDFSLETSTNGVQSIINLTGSDGTPMWPFIDLSWFDVDRKRWFWFNEQRLPFRVYHKLDENFPYSNTKYNYYFVSHLDIPDDGHPFGTNDLTTKYYIEQEDRKNWAIDTYNASDTKKVYYLYSPIMIVVEGKAFEDISNYTKFTSDGIIFNSTSTQNIKEFYYDFAGRIFTNQDLSIYDPKDVKIYFTTVPRSVSVKCRMRANAGSQPKTTPVVDYYILQLNGQSV